MSDTSASEIADEDSPGLVVSLNGVGSYMLHHGWESGTDTWIDGKIVFYNEAPALQLDIACTGEPSFPENVREAAREDWEAGTVYAVGPKDGGVLTLVIPADTLVTTDVIEALRRFRP